GRGRKLMYPALEQDLISFVKKRREERNNVTAFMIRKNAKELSVTLG
ncbi:16003_t:CDS:1, partial [Gigaspora rosea]